MTEEKDTILKEEEDFHDQWAKEINPNNLYVLEAFEGPVSPEYRFAIELLGKIKDRKVLNPGCGAGEEAVYLTKKGAFVSAIDISSEMLKIAQQLAKKFSFEEKIGFQKMNVEKLDFEANTFDLIFGNSILHHVDIEAAAAEFSRVLKNSGKAVFIEPLFYNPLINYYRRLSNIVRTPNEHPLKFSDLAIFKKYFRQICHHEFQFATLLIFCYFFLVQRVHPNQDRYWKKIIREGAKYQRAFKILFTLDKFLLRLFPFLRRFCWVTVIEVSK